jgi:hypothetical protein
MNSLIERNLPSWKINDPTKITEFYICPRDYFYQYVLGWRPEAPNNHLIFGTSWHKALEYLLTHDYSVESVVKAHEVFVSDYRKYLGPDTDAMYAPKTPDNALLVLNAYAKRFEQDLLNWEVLYTEIAGKITLTEEHIIYFVMDSILQHKQKGTVKSIDHKTASNIWNWELQFPLSMQNGAYSHVLNCLFHPDVVDGVVFRGSVFKKVKKAWEQLSKGQKLTYAEPYEFIEFPAKKSLDQMQTWMWNTTYILDQIKWNFDLLADCSEDDQVMTAFPLNPSSCTKFFGCPYLDFCQAWQNPLQRCAEPPLGFIESHWDPSQQEAKHTFNIGGDENA